MAAYAQQIVQIGLGHLALAACACFYIAWWCVFFRPDAKQKNTKVLRAAGIACIVLAAVFGVLAVAVVVAALVSLPASLPPFILIAGCIALYVVLLGVTSVVLDRPLTTELLLVVAWLALELSFLNGIASSGAVTGASLIIMALSVLVVFVVCIVCYVLYYHLEGQKAFCDGLVPLAAVGLLALVLSLLLI